MDKRSIMNTQLSLIMAASLACSFLTACSVESGKVDSQGSGQEDLDWITVESDYSWKVKDRKLFSEDTSSSRLALTHDACYELNTETGALYSYQPDEGRYETLTLDLGMSTEDLHYLYFGASGESTLEIVTINDDGTVLSECDTSGNLLNQVAIPEGLTTNNNISQVVSDDECWYVLSEGIAYQLDADGTGKALSDQEILRLVKLSNGICFLASENLETAVYRVNDARELTLWETIPTTCGSAASSGDQESVVILNSKIMRAMISDKVLTNETDLVSIGLTENEVKQVALGEESIRLLRMMDDGTYQIVTLEQTDETDTRQVIKLLTWNTGIQQLQDKVIQFNEENEQYRIEIINLSDDDSGTSFYDPANEDCMRELQLLMESDEVPDLIDASVFYDWRDYAAKGYFEELDGYITDSEVISQENYLENILDAGQVNGKTYFVPYSFDVELLWGKTEYVGENTGWTLEEALDCSDAHSEINIMNLSEEKSTSLRRLLQMSLAEFVDKEAQDCNFETELFYRVLEKCNDIAYVPYEGDWNDWKAWGDLVEENTLLEVELLSTPEGILALNGVREFEKDVYTSVHMKGYPSSDGSCYGIAYLTRGTYFVITTEAVQKDGAWEFIESYHSEYDDGFHYLESSIPARKDWIEKRMEKIVASTVSGLKVEEGEKLTDEEKELFREVAENARVLTTSEEQILDIICEEADAYFAGDKSVEDVAAIIQSRVGLFLKEGN